MKNKKQNKQQQQRHLHSHLVAAHCPRYGNWRDVGRGIGGHKKRKYKKKGKRISNGKDVMVSSMVHCCHPYQVAQVVLWHCVMLLVEKEWGNEEEKTLRQEKDNNNNQHVWLEKTINNQRTGAVWPPGAATTTTKTFGTETKERTPCRTKTIFLARRRKRKNKTTGRARSATGEFLVSVISTRYWYQVPPL